MLALKQLQLEMTLPLSAAKEKGTKYEKFCILSGCVLCSSEIPWLISQLVFLPWSIAFISSGKEIFSKAWNMQWCLANITSVGVSIVLSTHVRYLMREISRGTKKRCGLL